MSMTPEKETLNALYMAAVRAAHPATCLPPFLPAPNKDGRIIILAGGKAAGSMAHVAEQIYTQKYGLGPDRLTGIAITRIGYAEPTKLIRMIEAGHPLPNEAGLKATQDILTLAQTATENDHVLVLLSGGASANWIAPVKGLSLSDKQMITRALLRSGAPIDAMNTVRKRLSAIKGGRLCVAAYPAPVTTLAISDIPGDNPTHLGSGPTVADTTTQQEALEILDRYAIKLPQSLRTLLQDPANDTPDADHPAFKASHFTLIARPADGVRATTIQAQSLGYEIMDLGAEIEGEAREVAHAHASLALQAATAGRKLAIISGGELTVTIRGEGRGGPGQEYALALALALNDHPDIKAVAGDTDGTDGGGGSPDDPAGAFVFPNTLERAKAHGIDAQSYLNNNDSTGFFEAIGDLLKPGPTGTNINDIRVILIG
jgi:glycerate 2-kinase